MNTRNIRCHAAGRRTGRSVRWAAALLFGLMWWWAALRVALEPARSGPFEQGFAAGGWTLSVLPVHAVPRQRRQSPVPVPDRTAGPPAPRLPVPRRPRPADRQVALAAQRRPLSGATRVLHPRGRGAVPRAGAGSRAGANGEGEDRLGR